MARTIDERIVQMTFNNQEFERRASTTISTLGKLTQALDPRKLSNSFIGLQSVTNNLDFSGVRTALDGVSNGFSVMEQIAVGALRRVGDAIAGQLLGGLSKVKSTIDSMTTQQIGQGFQKYNDLTSSVQTLVNSTGKSVDEIDGYLKRLMWYSDETSFGFTDMTKALGTMVSAGGDIDELIPMLMGVGNAVAYAGKGASEFSRVIYNLNQSYSTGALKTMDWRSIELAGADSKVLKEQLIAAAVNLKTINKEQAKLSNFSDLVSKGKITREVMQQAFGAFAQMTLEAEKLVNTGVYDTASEAIESLSGRFEEFAERAFKSAQEAKSFKEAIEATQDAVSSGWMQTFQLVFGDYNESKALWTDVTNTFWEIFASGAKRRNDILEVWKEQWKNFISVKNPDDQINPIDFDEWKRNSQYLTQTQALLDAISQAVLAIRDSISDTFRSIFPIHTILDKDGKAVEDYSYIAEKIYNTIENIRNLFISIKEVGIESDFAVALRNNFRGLLEVIKTLITYVKTFNEFFIKPLVERLKPVADQLVGIFNKLGKIVQNTARNARSDMSPFEKFLTNLLNILQPIINLVEKLLDWINKLLEGTSSINIFDGIFTSIGKAVEFVAKVVNGSVSIFEKIGSVLSNILPKIKESISTFLTSHGADVSKLAEGGFLGVLAYGLTTVIKKFKDFNIKDLAKNFTGGLADGIKDVFTNLSDGIKNLLGGGGSNTTALKAMADAIMELALALLVMSLVDADKIVGGLTGLGVALAEAIGAISILNGMKVNKAATKALKSIAFAILELSVAIKIMSGIDPLGMAVALVGLGVVLGELAVFMSIMSVTAKDFTGGGAKGIAKILTQLGLALIEISIALKIMSTLDSQGLKTSLIAMGATLAGIAAFVVLIDKFTGNGAFAKIATLGPTMIGLGFALIEIAAALKLLSTIDGDAMKTALEAMLLALTEIGAFIVLVSNLTKGGPAGFLVISAGLLIMSAAIGALTIALIAMSAVGWDGLKGGLKTMAVMMAILAGSAVVLGIISPLMLAAALAMAAFGASLYVISAAMLKAIAAFTAFKLIGSDFVGSIVDVLTDAFAAIIAILPSFILGIVEAVIGMAGKLIELVSTLIQVVLTAVNENLPGILDSLITFIGSVLEGLGNAMDTWVPLLFDLAFGLINGLITQLRLNLPTLLENLFGLLIDAINGLANLIRSGGGELGAALGNLASALIEGIFGAIGGLVGGLADGVVSIGEGLWNGAQSLWGTLFGGETQTEEQTETGAAIVDNVATGMDENKQVAYDKADEIGNETAKEMEDAEEAKSSGKYTLDGLVEGLQDEGKLAEIFEAGRQAGKMFMLGYNSEMDQHSPSREMIKEAKFTVAGLIEGFKDLSDVSNAGETVGKAVYNSIASALSLANELMDDAMNPTITPVVDLSEIKANSGAIQGLFSNDLAYNGALSVSSLRTAYENQNGYNNNPITVNVDFTVNNAGRDLTEADVMKFSKQISKEVDVRLGKLLRI